MLFVFRTHAIVCKFGECSLYRIDCNNMTLAFAQDASICGGSRLLNGISAAKTACTAMYGTEASLVTPADAATNLEVFRRAFLFRDASLLFLVCRLMLCAKTLFQISNLSATLASVARSSMVNVPTGSTCGMAPLFHTRIGMRMNRTTDVDSARR